MSPDLSERMLGVSIDDPGDRQPSTPEADEPEELERFVYVAIGEHRLAFPVDDVKTITDPPEPADVTNVPRAPPAVNGLVDIRGEITALVDPRVHFPADEPPTTKQRLLVFDRPTDQQSAAITIDEVFGVQTVPEADVHGPEDVDDPTVAGGAINHPLIVALVEQERRAERSGRGNTTRESRFGRTNQPDESLSLPTEEANDDVVSDEFVLEEEPEKEQESEQPPEIIVEATGLVDVERLLLASGHES
ncbi:chemotaxis protein CheW [Halobacteria archaeon AArc-curdl1]|uniref:Chemotaxis protein CheW n=1 Tax=Natronosalvus hydrolyticus TaxID=2979988 RepID=A0AAP3E7Z4_9EURY|nr:chemotaxis protein CheW [Halobacteria archaeon AArc-curdl1]